MHRNSLSRKRERGISLRRENGSRMAAFGLIQATLADICYLTASILPTRSTRVNRMHTTESKSATELTRKSGW